MSRGFRLATSELPRQVSPEEIDYRDAIIGRVVRDGSELTSAGIIDLWNLEQKSIARGVCHPEYAVGVEVHICLFQLL